MVEDSIIHLDNDFKKFTRVLVSFFYFVVTRPIYFFSENIDIVRKFIILLMQFLFKIKWRGIIRPIME